VLLMPLLHRAGSHMQALTTPYTCLYQPSVASGCDLAAAVAALAPLLAPVLRIDGIDPDWEGWCQIRRGFRRAGRLVMAFASFVNWREKLRGRSWSAYVSERPGALRETIRRRLGKAERDPDCRFTLAETPAEAARLLQDYETIRAASWKPAEPHPAFAAAFVAAAARAGVLRIAALHRNDIPIAAQYWTVERGVATVHKLVYDQTARCLSPGTVLTAWMIRHLIEVELVAELDFGRGDDPYKAAWATTRRRLGGLIVANPYHPFGAAALLRQSISGVGGPFRKRPDHG
jgi:CelD/BcsL family acetyltransferase involved in cellulose biosynthesis